MNNPKLSRAIQKASRDDTPGAVADLAQVIGDLEDEVARLRAEIKDLTEE
jgi:uncharacterized small protein (DUF1192 family)